jgi:4-hydroxy-3-methylbut-2-en-1-yl diphosphate synthase IspG/GcpE
METPKRQPPRAVRVGQVQIGAGAPVAVQSMCAAKTRDVGATERTPAGDLTDGRLLRHDL